MAMLLYGAGLRLRECLRLPVKDVDFTRDEIVVRQGKGDKDRVTTRPARVKGPLDAHLERVRHVHACDLATGFGRVQLPDALAPKYVNANRDWGWHWIVPASKVCRDQRFGEPQRYHIHESVVQKAIHAPPGRPASRSPSGRTPGVTVSPPIS